MMKRMDLTDMLFCGRRLSRDIRAFGSSGRPQAVDYIPPLMPELPEKALIRVIFCDARNWICTGEV